MIIIFKYTIIANEYQESIKLTKKILNILQDDYWKEDINNPKYVFVIGGDGTLLRAVNKFQNNIDEIFFIVIKSGSLGFYTNYDENNYYNAIITIINNNIDIKKIPLLEIKYNNNVINYALNEVKIIDHVKTIRTNIFVNNNLLEHFRGSGLVFSTKTGSTGYMKAINGAIIAANYSLLWQLKEIAPIANSKFSTINSSVIFDQEQVVKLIGGLKKKSLIIDTYELKILSSEIELKISKKTLNLFYDKENDLNIISKMRILFTNCNDNINNN